MSTDIPLDQTTTPGALNPITQALLMSDLLIMSRPSTSGSNDPIGDYKVTLQQIHDWVNGFINDHFKGLYASSGGLEGAVPTASDGDYAIVDSGNGQPTQYIWDSLANDGDGGWVAGSSGGGGGGPSTTDSLPEGNSNLYFTAARAVSALNAYYLRFDMQQELNSAQMTNARRALGILGSTNMAPWDLTPQPVGQQLSSNYPIGRYSPTSVDINNTITLGTATQGDTYSYALFPAPLSGLTPEWVCVVPDDSGNNSAAGYQFRIVVAKALTDLDDPGDGGLYIALCYDSDNPGLYIKTGVGGNSSTTMVSADYRPGTPIMLSINPTNLQLVIDIGTGPISTNDSVVNGTYYVFGVLNIFSGDSAEHVLQMQMSTNPNNLHGRAIPGGAIPINTLQVLPPSDADKGVDYYVLQNGQYTNPYGTQETFELFACDVVRFANPTNIKYVIRNNNAADQVVQPWNAAPTVVTNVPSVGVSDSYGVTTTMNGGVLESMSLDLTATPGSLGPYATLSGAVRTTVTLAALMTNPNAVVIGQQITSAIDHTKVVFTAIIIAPTSVSAETLATSLLTSGYNTAPFIQSVGISIGMSEQLGISGKIVNDSGPQPFSAYGNNTSPPGIDEGLHQSLVLCYVDGSLRVAQIDVSGDASAFDVLGGTQIGSNPVIPFADMAVFFVVAQASMTPDFSETTIAPDMSFIMNGGTVVFGGTTYENHGGTGDTWNATFPGGLHELETLTVTQAAFPNGTLVGDILETKVTGSYPATPYDTLVTNNQKVVVENVTPGQEAFTILAQKTDVDPVSTALTALAATVTSQGTTITALTNSLLAATYGADEVVVYVSSANTDATTYSSLDAAYTYLITLPPFIKKRMVLDDSDANYAKGSVGTGASAVTYNFMENNIVISTLKAWNGEVLGAEPSPTTTYLVLRCTSLYLDHFAGTVSCAPTPNGGNPYVMAIGTGITLGTGTETNNNLVIGNNCDVWTSTAADMLNGPTFNIDNTNGCTINVGDNSTLIWYFFNQNNSLPAGVIQAPIFFVEGNNTSINLATLVGQTITLNGSVSPPVNITAPRDGTLLSVTGMAYTLTYNGQNTNNLIPGVTIINRASDFGPTGEGNIAINPGMYFIAGEVDLGGYVLTPQNSGPNNCTFTFLGIRGVSKLANVGNVIFAGAPSQVFVDGCDMQTDSGSPALQVAGLGLSLKNCSIAAAVPFNLQQYSGANPTLTIDGVDFPGVGGAFVNGPLLCSDQSNGNCVSMGIRINNMRVNLVAADKFIDFKYAEGQIYTINDVVFTNNVAAVAAVTSLGYQSVGDTISLSNIYAATGQGGVNYEQVYTLVWDNDTGEPYDHTTGEFVRCEGSVPYAVAHNTALRTINCPTPTVATLLEFVNDAVDLNRFAAVANVYAGDGLLYRSTARRFRCIFTASVTSDTDSAAATFALVKLNGVLDVDGPSGTAFSSMAPVALTAATPQTVSWHGLVTLNPQDQIQFQVTVSDTACNMSVNSSSLELFPV